MLGLRRQLFRASQRKGRGLYQRETCAIALNKRGDHARVVWSKATGNQHRSDDVRRSVENGRKEAATALFKEKTGHHFAKVGVGSRTELVAALFDDHYATDFFAKVTAHD